MIKRIQNTMIQALTDAINLILISTGNSDYINEYQLRMQSPTTQEEKDRRENISSKVGLVSEVMNTLSDIESVPTKLKILKSLLSNSITDTDVISLIQDEIDRLEAEAENEEMPPSEESFDDAGDLPDMFSGDSGISDSSSLDFDEPTFDDLGLPPPDEIGMESEPASAEDSLPSPADLDIGDMSDLTNPNLG